MVGIGIAAGSAEEGGVAGLGICPSRYPITLRDFAAETIDSFHSAQFEPSNFSSVGKTKFAGCDIIYQVSVRVKFVSNNLGIKFRFGSELFGWGQDCFKIK